MRRWRAWLRAAGASAAIAYLLLMVAGGTRPQYGESPAAGAAGVLGGEPGGIHRVTLRDDARQLVFLRRDHGWLRPGGEAYDEDAVAAVERAVKFMHTSRPVRVLHDAAWRADDLADYQLDHPHLSVSLERADGSVVEAVFGGFNADGLLQYMRISGDAELYLMSRFVGAAWHELAHAVK